jgi:hypothetical protein
MRCGRQEITIVAEKVRVSLPLMAEPKGKKVLDVDFMRGTRMVLLLMNDTVTERNGNRQQPVLRGTQ